VVTASTLNLRAGPGPGYESVGQLALGDIVTLLGRTSNKSWLKVLTASGIEGWATQRYLKANGLITPLPVLADADPWASVSAATLNVRSGPGLEFEVVVTLNKGTLVTVLGRSANRLWAKILVEGAEGWANTGRLKISIPLSFLPVVE
jgi:N-acetylmuramoyl-L-alanine amidase